MHEELLNEMLADSCPVHTYKNEDDLFVLELHCGEAWVRARLVSTYKTIQYDIISWKIGYSYKAEDFLLENEEHGYWINGEWYKV